MRSSTWALAAVAGAALTIGAPVVNGASTAASAPLVAFEISTGSGSNDVWAMPVAGGPRDDLGPGSEPVLSPTGQLVAASLTTDAQAQSGGVVVYSTTGAAPIEVPSLASETVAPIAFSPDSRYLALSVNLPTTGAPVAQLDVLDLQTGALSDVARGAIAGVSFKPAAAGELVYSRAASDEQSASYNLYTWAPGQPASTRITGNGRSLNPVWGPHYIAFDEEYSHNHAVQIWLLGPSGVARRLTNVPVGELQFGLSPVGFSADGSRLLAEYQQQDDPQSYMVDVPSGRAQHINITGQGITVADGISADGRHVLLQVQIYQGGGLIEAPATGGAAKLLVKDGVLGSWNE